MGFVGIKEITSSSSLSLFGIHIFCFFIRGFCGNQLSEVEVIWCVVLFVVKVETFQFFFSDYVNFLLLGL